jgi:hypothetical protein
MDVIDIKFRTNLQQTNEIKKLLFETNLQRNYLIV